MALRGFKPTVALTDDWAKAQISDTATRRALKLTGTEARVLQLFDGTQSAAELALSARAKGLAIEPPQVAVLLDRLAKAGFLEPVAPPTPAAPPAAAAAQGPGGPLEPGDRVPCLRVDLVIAPTPGSRGTLQVTDPQTQRSFTLYDFEVSIARMLNGLRTAQQVIEAATAIGIPVDLSSLEKFFRQLKAYHFLDESPGAQAVRGAGTTWPSRAVWTPEVRGLYQSALRMLRAGKLQESLDYLYALLQIDPENSDALETKARVEEQLAGEIAFDITFEELHGESTVSSDQQPGEVEEGAAEPGGSAAEDDAPAGPPPARASKGRSRQLIAGAAVLVLGGLFFPVARVRYVQGELKPVAVGKVTSPRAGTVSNLKVGEGQVVEKGAPLVELASNEQEAERSKLSARAKELEFQAELTRAKIKPTAVDKAKVALAARQKDLDKALEDKHHLEGAKRAPKALKAKAEKQLKLKQAAFDKARAELSAATFEARLAANVAEAAKVKEQLDRLAATSITTVSAPSAGRVRGLVQSGTEVASGADLATLVSPTALTAQVKDPQLPPRATVARATVSANGVSQALGAVHWEDGPGQPVLVGTLDPAPKSVGPGPTVLEVTLGRKPFLLTLFGRN